MELAWDSSFSIFAEPKWNLLTLALGLLINLSESNLNHRDALGLLRTEKGDFIEFITLMVSYWWSNDREADQVIIAGCCNPFSLISASQTAHALPPDTQLSSWVVWPRTAKSIGRRSRSA